MPFLISEARHKVFTVICTSDDHVGNRERIRSSGSLLTVGENEAGVGNVIEKSRWVAGAT
jgi:hypothetical protein